MVTKWDPITGIPYCEGFYSALEVTVREKKVYNYNFTFYIQLCLQNYNYIYVGKSQQKKKYGDLSP